MQLANRIAAGRKEITTFFYLYTLLTICSLIIDCGVVPPGSEAYGYFVAVQCGLACSTCICLMINGFVGFQLYEDGTTLSVWLLRVCSLTMFIIGFVVSLLTFKGWAGLSPDNTIGLFVVVYIFSAIFLFVYIVMQIMLVLGTLQERWPMWHIGFGVAAFVIGQILLYAFSETICDNVQHYMDGLFFATLLNLLAVMMVYKVRPQSFAASSLFSANILCSSGTPSHRKISNSQSASDQTTGRSRIRSSTTTPTFVATPSTTTPTSPPAPTTSPTTTAAACTVEATNLDFVVDFVFTSFWGKKQEFVPLLFFSSVFSNGQEAFQSLLAFLFRSIFLDFLQLHSNGVLTNFSCNKRSYFREVLTCDLAIGKRMVVGNKDPSLARFGKGYFNLQDNSRTAGHPIPVLTELDDILCPLLTFSRFSLFLTNLFFLS